MYSAKMNALLLLWLLAGLCHAKPSLKDGDDPSSDVAPEETFLEYVASLKDDASDNLNLIQKGNDYLEKPSEEEIPEEDVEVIEDPLPEDETTQLDWNDAQSMNTTEENQDTLCENGLGINCPLYKKKPKMGNCYARPAKSQNTLRPGLTMRSPKYPSAYPYMVRNCRYFFGVTRRGRWFHYMTVNSILPPGTVITIRYKMAGGNRRITKRFVGGRHRQNGKIYHYRRTLMVGKYGSITYRSDGVGAGQGMNIRFTARRPRG